MLKFFKKTLISAMSTLLSLAVVLIVMVGVFMVMQGRGPDIEDHSWLVVDLYGDVLEYDPPGDIMGKVLGGDGETLTRILDNLDKAALDERIDGVIFRLSSTHNAGPGKLEEMRNAVKRVQAAGKPVFAWGDAMDNSALFVASACDSIFMPGGGYFQVKGLHAGSLHVRGMLEKLGITPYLHKIKDYKAATEMVMDSEMSEYAREMLTWILDEVWDMTIPVIAEERGMTEQQLIELMEYAEFEPSEAVAAGLIDEVLYWQDMEARYKLDDEDGLRTVSMATYAEVSWKDVGVKGDRTVAVVHAQGNIGGRKNRIDPLLGTMMGHESIIAELRRCRFDDDVEAVVFRVDSGGGESLASDLIAHEIDLLAGVKPVVVSMVDVAASGGYMISFRAPNLMANSLTITGSIGSINGFFDLSGFRDKVGLNVDHVTKGPMAMLGTDDRAPTSAEWERHADAHWKSFNTWLQDVADRRGMAFEDAEKLAHGRIWTGRQAVANGLIDRTGDLRDAVTWAAELAEFGDDQVIRVVHLPESKGLLATILSGEDAGGDVALSLKSALWSLMRQDVGETARFLQSGAANVVTP